MKDFFTGLIIITLAIVINTIPQQISAQNPIPNPDFEEWSGGEPTGWNTINQSVLGTSFVCVTRDQTNPQSGSSCVKVETVTHNIFLVGPVTMPGILSLGEITLDILNQTGSVTGGVPINTQPNQLKGWFRYQPSAGDSCIMGIGLSRWNGTGRDTLAYAYTVIGGQNPNWQEFSVPIEYLIWGIPDTMNIMFFSSNLLTGSPVTGSELWIDNLILEYGPVDVVTTAIEKDPMLKYDQDGCPIISLNGEGRIVKINIIGLTGACIQNIIPAESRTEIRINTSAMKAGIYLACILTSDGSYKTIKFVRH